MAEHKEGNGVERRINLAVTLATISTTLTNLEKTQDTCQEDRNALYKRIGQVDVQLGKIETHQKTITWVGSIFTIAGLTAVVRYIVTHFKSGS